MKFKKTFISRIALLATLLSVCLFSGMSQTGGFANVSIGGTSVTVTSSSQLLDYISRSGQYTINVSGSISISGMNDVASDKAIIGVGTSARITGGGLDIDGVNNVVVQNITFEGSNDDAINVQEGSTNIWIDHCSFGSCSDGQVDIKRESDYVTVSWCHFYNHDHCCLLGHSDSHTEDIGHLRVTYHHNFFEGEGRNPRVRFSALCHVYNNYYNGCDYGVASTMDAECLVEGNYFNNVDDPCLVGYASSGDGDLVERNNIYVNSGSPETSGSVPNPSYSYSLDNASNIPSIVSSGAGANGTTGGDDGGGDDGGDSGDQYYNLVNRISGKYIDVLGASQSDGADIIQWTSNGGYNQQWEMLDAGSGYVFLKVRHSGKCMRGLNGNVIQYTCNSGYWSEMFERIDAGSGYYILKNRHTQTCLRVENSSGSDGASIILDNCNTGYWSQQFSFSSAKSTDESIGLIDPISDVTVYPNPANDYLNVVLPSDMQEGVSIRIVNNIGQMVIDQTQLNGPVNTIDISSLNAGMYIVQISKGQEVVNKIFSKQ